MSDPISLMAGIVFFGAVYYRAEYIRFLGPIWLAIFITERGLLFTGLGFVTATVCVVVALLVIYNSFFTKSGKKSNEATNGNMVEGVSQGFRKTLDLVGVGYRAKAEGKGLEIALGYSHPVIINAVDGITFTVEGGTKIHVDGIDKTLVGQISADIRSKRAPEPYKGKGVKYSTEVIRRKEGKKS